MATFTNQATLTYNGQTVNSNTVTGQMISPLTMTKTALDDVYATGDTITYVVSLVNDGSTTYDDLTLTDNLGSSEVGGEEMSYPLSYVPNSIRYFINGVLQSAPTVSPEEPLTVTGISVPAGGNTMLIYETEVTAAAPLTAGSVITNTVTLTGDELSCTLEAEATVRVECGPELRIVKSLFPAVVPENGQLTYSFLIQNYGNEAAEEDAGVSVSDLFDPILEDITVELDGQPLCVNTDYTYNQTTGQFNTVPGMITVPAATYAQDTATGDWIVTPGEVTLTVQGTVSGCSNA